jgi:CoA:oxalate CoA-transferase
MAARGSFSELGAEGARFLVANAPYQLSATPTLPRATLAGLGEHTDAVLAEKLGLSAGQLAELRGHGVFGAVPAHHAEAAAA